MDRPLAKLERVTDDELALLYKYRNLDRQGRELLGDFVDVYAERRRADLPANVLTLPGVRR